jgi:hypothetical protein
MNSKLLIVIRKRGVVMGITPLSPKSSLRKSIRDINRSRGHGNHNLWYFYSPKTDKDWVFPSDRQFVHWLYFLEANPEVVSFDLAPGVVISSDHKETRGTELDAIVVFQDGHIEWHEVKAGSELLDSDSSQFAAQRKAATEASARYVIFNDKQLIPISNVAIRWIDALAYANAIRGESHTACQNAIVTYAHYRKAGSLGGVLNDLSAFDPPVVIGLLVRMATKGIFKLDLEEASFGYRTRWSYGR